MSRWLYLPNSIIGDLRILANLSDDSIRKLSRLMDSPHKKKGYRLFLQIAETLGITDQGAASLFAFCDYVQDERSTHKKTSTDVFDEIDYFLSKRGSGIDAVKDTSNAETLALLRSKRDALEILFGELPSRERSRKVRLLQGGPLPHFSSIKAYCDVRPVYNADGTNIDDLISLVTLKITTHSPDEEPKDVVLQLADSDLEAIRTEFVRLRRKLNTLRRRFPELNASSRRKPGN